MTEKFDQLNLMLYLQMQSFLIKAGNSLLYVLYVEGYNIVDKSHN